MVSGVCLDGVVDSAGHSNAAAFLQEQAWQLFADLCSDRRWSHSGTSLLSLKRALGLHSIAHTASLGSWRHCGALCCYIGNGEEVLLRKNAILKG